MSCGVGCRRVSDPALLWLWCRPAATALIGPLAWEPPYCHRCGPKKTITKKDYFELIIFKKLEVLEEALKTKRLPLVRDIYIKRNLYKSVTLSVAEWLPL